MDGRYVRLRDARCEPKPVQRPHPPITIGGRGPKRTLRAAARWAQQWNAITSDPEDWAGLKEILIGHCADLGRDPDEITCSVNVRLEPDQDVREVVDAVEAYRSAGVDLAIVGLPLGAKPQILDSLAGALDSLD